MVFTFYPYYQQKRDPIMQLQSKKKLYTVVVWFDNATTRTVKVKATTREAAEAKALKFNPSAKGVKRDV